MPQTSSEALKAASALKAAKMYYLQDLTMGAIATELRTSRSSVSRLLSFARESGLVDIRITSPFDRAPLSSRISTPGSGSRRMWCRCPNRSAILIVSSASR